MSRERMMWNLDHGVYHLTAEQEEAAAIRLEAARTVQEVEAVRVMIAEAEAANG